MPVLRFFINACDHEAWEIPKSKVHPGSDHHDISTYLESHRSDVHDHLENANCEISHIVQNHDCGTHWQVVDHVREVDESKGKEVMKDILGEILSLTVKYDRISQLIQMIGELENVEIIHHAGQFLARMIKEEKRSRGSAADPHIEEVAIFTKHNVVERKYAENVHCNLEHTLTEHLSFGISLLRSDRELSLRNDFHEKRLSKLF